MPVPAAADDDDDHLNGGAASGWDDAFDDIEGLDDGEPEAALAPAPTAAPATATATVQAGAQEEDADNEQASLLDQLAALQQENQHLSSELEKREVRLFRLWMRISAMIYNDMADYERVSEVMWQMRGANKEQKKAATTTSEVGPTPVPAVLRTRILHVSSPRPYNYNTIRNTFDNFATVALCARASGAGSRDACEGSRSKCSKEEIRKVELQGGVEGRTRKTRRVRAIARRSARGSVRSAHSWLTCESMAWMSQ